MQEMKGMVVRPRYSLPFVIFIQVACLLMIYLAIINNRNSTQDIVARIAVSCVYFVIFLAPFADYFWGFIGFFDQRYVVDSTGVTCFGRRYTYSLKWEDIQHIMIYPDMYGRIKKHCFICFIATEGIPGNLSKRSNYNEKAFGIQYHPKLAEMIEQLSGREIEQLDYLKR